MKVKVSTLSRIIAEETVAVLREKRIQQTEPSNPYHDEDGKFSSYEDSKSWSLEDKQKEMKSGKNVKPCGRGERRKCKAPQELKWEQLLAPIEEENSESKDTQLDGLYVQSIIRNELKRMMGNLKGRTRGGCSLDDVLNVIKRIKAAEQYKPPKRG